MILNKNTGDDLAIRFNEILGKNIKKFAKMGEDPHGLHQENDMSHGDHSDDLKDMLLENDAMEGHLMENNLEHDMMEGHLMENHLEHDMMEGHLMENHLEHDMMEGHMMTAEAQRIMSGLGKIAGSLKRKGEVFAADVVEATALSIRDDFKKQAAISTNRIRKSAADSNRKDRVLFELSNMADRLSKKGNLRAAKEVLKTARKISKS